MLIALVVIALAAVALTLPPLSSEPAAAAPPALSVTLTTENNVDDSRIGEWVTFRAAVEAATPGQEVLQNGWAVVFSGTGNGDWTSGVVYAEDGEATFSRTSPIIGTETVTAAVVNTGCGGARSNSVAIDWWFPTLTVSPDSVSAHDTTFTLTAQLSHDGQPIAGQQLSVRVDRFFPADDAAVDSYQPVTDDEGIARVPWSLATDAAEAITVEEVGPSIPASAGTSHVWDDTVGTNVSISLTPSNPSRRVGETVTITAHATIGGSPAIGETVLLYSSSFDGIASAPTDPAGSASFDVTADQSGPDVVVAGLSGRQGSFSTVLDRWYPMLDVSPQQGEVEADRHRVFIGNELTPVVTFSHSGIPVVGSEVDLSATNAAAPTITRSAETGTDGRAVFDSWTRDQAGTDAIAVREASDEESEIVTHAVWERPASNPLGLALTQSPSTTIRVGSAARLVAVPTYTDHFGEQTELTGWDVSLRESPGGPVVASGVSGPGGAILTVTQDNEGATDFIASIEVEGCDRVVSAPVRVTWALPQLTLEPPTAVGPARSDLALRGRLQLGGQPVAGAQLTYASRSQACAIADLTGFVTTDEAGFATFSLRRDGPSIDRVTLTEVGVVQPQTAQSRAVWGSPDEPPIRVGLSQSSPDGRVGTSVTVVARVTDFDGGVRSPLADVPVTLSGTDRTAPLITDENGTVRYSYRRPVPRTDRITASTPYGCDRVASGPIDHEWWLPTLTLQPDTATSTVGAEARVVATLTHDGAPLPGIPLSFEVVSSNGQPTLPDGAQPATINGRAELAWARTRPGLDTITVHESSVTLPTEESATHRWRTPRPRLGLAATPDGTSGPIGETFTVHARVEIDEVAEDGVDVRLVAAMPGQPDVVRTTTTTDSGRGDLSWSRDVPGEESVTVTATLAGATAERTLTRTWTVPSGPDTPSPQSPSPQSPSQESPSPESPSAGSPSAESPSAGPSETTPTPVPREKPTDLPPTSIQVNGPEVGRPGGDIEVAGTGCRPGEAVTIRLGGNRLGTTRAAGDGTFYLRTVVPDLALGRYVIRSSCGTTIGDPNVDITAPQVNKGLAGIAAVGATTASTFVFFLLVAKGIISFLPRRPL